MKWGGVRARGVAAFYRGGLWSGEVSGQGALLPVETGVGCGLGRCQGKGHLCLLQRWAAKWGGVRARVVKWGGDRARGVAAFYRDGL